MKKILLLILTLAMTVSLSGCGQKGPLTLPEEPVKNEKQNEKN